MSDKNNDQELEKTTDATADEVTSETETNDAIESVPADSVQFSVTFDDVDDESTVDDGIYSALASAETGETDETSEAEADAIASVNASAEVTERNAARVNETLFNRSVGFMTDLLQTAQQVNLLAGLAFFQQRSAGFHRSRLNADEAVELKNLTKRIDNTLLHNTFGGEPLRES